MKIFSAQQIRDGDAYTIRHEPVSGIDLMERAAKQCVAWITSHYAKEHRFYVFCGTGNNGGDGLAVTRLLHQNGYQAVAYLAGDEEKLTEDCRENRSWLENVFASPLDAIHAIDEFPVLPANAVIIDALFGTGLNRPLEGLYREIVLRINEEADDHDVIAIDMPSGLKADSSSADGTVVTAKHTLSFEFFKLAFLLPENGKYVGELAVLPIGILPQYIAETPTDYHVTDEAFIRSIYKKRNIFSHKGTYGHALIVAGSYGKIGAAVLAAKACLHSGAGLVTAYLPSCGYQIMQSAVPEAMCLCDSTDWYLSRIPEDVQMYEAVGLGPGIDQRRETVQALHSFLKKHNRPLVLDADALNIIGKENLHQHIPADSILTPHPKEFERLFGKTKNDFDRLDLQRAKSKALQVYIVLKGHFTCITTPGGTCFFNPTGNAGMATGGSGDVLTGILTGLLAQGYSPFHTAVLGVYLHGLAGDIAARINSMESMTASDIVASMGEAFQKLAMI